MSILDSIKEARRKNINVCLADPRRVITDFKEEKKTTDDYNGRQILELLQNVDDAHSKDVKIELDTVSKILTVSNNGDPFSDKGFESLLLANNSSKTNKEVFIGNKGLGFRSILNWANSIEILSNRCLVEFSEKISKKVVESELSSKIDDINSFKIESGFSETAFAYPILAFPEFSEKSEISSWVTEIRIHYKDEFQEDIIKQLNQVSVEVLLFVRSIENIEIIQDSVKKKYSSDKEVKESYTAIYLHEENPDVEKSDVIYRVFNRKGLLPSKYQEKNDKNEKLSYEIAIAIGDDFSVKKNFVYSFFKTDIEISLPCIIHGSFDLNSSRTQLTQSDVNNFIVRKIAREICKISLFIKNDSEIANWNSFELVYPKGNAVFRFYELFELLSQFRGNAKICPCVDNKYRKINETVFYSDDFSKKVELKYSEYFPLMVKSYKDPLKNIMEKALKYKPEFFWPQWAKIASSQELTFESRVELICLLSQLEVSGCEKKLPLLLDANGLIIDEETDAYTPAAQKLYIPSYMNVKFMSQKLFNALVENLVPEGGVDSNKARNLCQKIRTFINIQEYDISNLTPKIISRGNKLADEKKDASYIKEMIKSLYFNYKNSTNNRNNTETKYEGVRLVSRAGTFESPNTLYFSSSYDSGKITEVIYGENLSEREYIVEKTFWDFEETEKFEDFFSLLGVERSLRIYKKELSCNDRDYYDVELSAAKNEKYNSYRQRPNNLIKQIENLSRLENLSPTKILVLLCQSSEILSELITPEKLSYKSYGAKGQYEGICVKKSFIAYQLAKFFSNVIIDNDEPDINTLIEDKYKIDYTLLEQNEIHRDTADFVLNLLGACKKLDDYPTSILYSLIQKIPAKFPDGKKVQKIYGLIYDILKKRDVASVPNDLMLACRIGNVIEYRLSNQIYYYDDATLPQSILKTMPVLLFRQRAGVDAVCRLFGVHKLNSNLLNLLDGTIEKNEKLTHDFEKYLNKRIPYILAYRLRSIKGQKDKEFEASKILKLSIELVHNGSYHFNNETKIFDNYDFVVKEATAYIKVPVVSISELIKDNSFLDICCEIIGITFALDSTDLKKIFKSVLKDELCDSKYDIINEMGEDYLQECNALLGLTETDESRFWNKIFKNKGIEEFSYSSRISIVDYVQEKLGIELPKNCQKIDFVDFYDKESFDFLKNLCQTLKINPQICLSEEGLKKVHRKQLEYIILDNKNKFKALLWKKINAQPIEKEDDRLNFANVIFRFENCFTDINLDSCKFDLNANLRDALFKFVRESFEIDLATPIDEVYIERCLYSEILSEDKYDDRLRKLSIFEGYEIVFQNAATAFKQIEQLSEGAQSIDAATPEPGVPTVVNFGLIVPKENTNEENSTITPRPPKPRNHNPNTDKRKRELGEEAEQRVIQWLEDHGYEKDIKSSLSGGIDSNDAAHCDLRYKFENEWRYLEVKHVSNDSFTITSRELSFAFERDHKASYDLALVKDDNVEIIQAPFNNDSDEKSFLRRFNASDVAYTIPYNFVKKGESANE